MTHQSIGEPGVAHDALSLSLGGSPSQGGDHLPRIVQFLGHADVPQAGTAVQSGPGISGLKDHRIGHGRIISHGCSSLSIGGVFFDKINDYVPFFFF